MRKKNMWGVLLLSLFTVIGLTSCSDDDPTPFTFYDNYYEVPVNGIRHLGLKTGHRDYSVEVEDPRLAYAEIEDGWTDPNGMIVLHGRYTGVTTLVVTDNKTNTKHVLKVRVVCNYESMNIFSSKPEHPLQKFVHEIFFLNNTERDVLFLKREPISSSDYKMVLVGRGTYAFSKEGDDYYLTMNYPSNDNGVLIETAMVPPPSKFLITDWGDFLRHKLNQSLNLGWETTPDSDSEKGGNWSYTWKMEEVGTKYKLSGSVPIDAQLPEGILTFN